MRRIYFGSLVVVGLIVCGVWGAQPESATQSPSGPDNAKVVSGDGVSQHFFAVSDDVTVVVQTKNIKGIEAQEQIVGKLVKSTLGCWLHVWEDDDYKGKDGFFHGPANYPKLDDYDWGDEIDSLSAGPKTWVEVFEDNDFDDKRMYIYPNQSYPVLDNIGFGDDIDSIKIYDSKPAHFP